MANIKEAFEEVTIYVVHSDANENNILQDFDDLSEALEYAKDNIDELTYVEEVVMNPESEEIYSTEVIWSYDEDDAEDQVVCEWCHELTYESECRRELNLGLICKDCQSALYSRGEKPVFEEAYDSDYAEGDDIFAQDFPAASTESKYNLEESSEPKWNIGSNKLVDRDSIEYQYLEELAARLQEERPYNEDGDYVFYEVARTYEDYGAGMEWYTIIVNDPKSFAGSYQLLYPNQWIKLANTGNVEAVLEDILNGSQLNELFDISVNAAVDGGDNNDVSVLSSYEPKKGEDKLDELFDADINLSLDGGTGNNVSVLSPLGGLGEDLQEGLNNAEFAEYMQLCKEIGILGHKDLEAFMNEVGLEAGCPAQDVLQALREYRAELGPDFKIIHEEADVELTELFGFGKKKQAKNRYVLVMFKDKSGRLFTSELWRDICDTVNSYAGSHEKSRTKHFSAPTLFQIEFVATEQTANNLKREIDTLLEDLPYQRKYISGTRDHVNGAGEINADVAKSAKYLIKMECIEKNITEALNEEHHIDERNVDREIAGYIVVDADPFMYAKYWGLGWEKKALDKIDSDDGGLDEVFYDSIMTDDLEEAEVYPTVEDALSAIEEIISMPGTSLIKREDNKSIKIDWTGTGDHFFTYEVKKLIRCRYYWRELGESLKEEVKLATNQKGDYLVAAESGKGYTVFSKDNVHLGGFDGEDDKAAIDRFNKGDFKESLNEGYKTDLLQIRVKEIKSELDVHGDITFDLPEPIDESDEDGWRGASEIIIVEKEGGEYEGYYQWLDQDGDLIEADADLYFEDFEELLYWLDDYLANIVDLEEYIGSEIAEGLKEARDPKEETELRTQDPNKEPEDQPEQVIEVDSKVLEESQSQEISNEYSRLSKKYGIDFEDLVYGEGGFMQTKYPGGFPDFDGDVIYSEKYFNELKAFMSVWKKANELIAKSETSGQKLKRVPANWLEDEKIRREIENPAIKAKARFMSPENNIYVFPEDIFNDAFKNIGEKEDSK